MRTTGDIPVLFCDDYVYRNGPICQYLLCSILLMEIAHFCAPIISTLVIKLASQCLLTAQCTLSETSELYGKALYNTYIQGLYYICKRDCMERRSITLTPRAYITYVKEIAQSETTQWF